MVYTVKPNRERKTTTTKKTLKHGRTKKRDFVQPPPIRLGTITQMEAFMKPWWKQSALYNAQPCTLLHFQLIRGAQLQKGERLPRQPPISPPPLFAPSVPLSRLLSTEVAWQREVQPLLYWNQCKNMQLHNKARMESWEQWRKHASVGAVLIVFFLKTNQKKKKKPWKKEPTEQDLSWRFALFGQANTCVPPMHLHSPFRASEWVCFASWCRALKEDCASAELVPKYECEEKRREEKSAPNKTPALVWGFFYFYFLILLFSVCIITPTFLCFWRCVWQDNSEWNTPKVISCLQSRSAWDGREILSCAPGKCGFMLPADWSKLPELAGLLPLEQGK